MPITKHEKCFIDNKAAMKQVQRGLIDAKAGRMVSKVSFAKYLKADNHSG